jgi:hypothetical protein
MRPFLTGKAIPNPDGRLLRRFERQGTERIAQALNRLKLDLFRGINNDNVYELVNKLDNPEVIQPFQDVMLALVQEWALAGADFGREQIEKEVLGTI